MVDRNQQGYPVRAILTGEDGGAPQVQLSGSRAAGEGTKTQADLVEGVVTFDSPILGVEIMNRDTANDGVFTVNGADIEVPAGAAWGPTLVEGTPSAEVAVTGSTAFLLNGYR